MAEYKWATLIKKYMLLDPILCSSCTSRYCGNRIFGYSNFTNCFFSIINFSFFLFALFQSTAFTVHFKNVDVMDTMSRLIVG
jgi:hypothetical protein